MVRMSRIGSAFFLCLAGFCVLAGVLPRHFGFPLDDSWIHQTVARNLVETHVFGYLPGVHSSGSSSLLWTMVLLVPYVFSRVMDPVVYSTVLNAMLLGLTGAGLMYLAERDGLPQFDAWVLGLAPMLNANFAWLGLLGMEHVLFVALSVGTVCLWFADRNRGWVLPLTVVLMGLLTMTRPEGLFLLGVLVLFRRRAKRSWGEVGALLAAVAVCEGLVLRVNWIASQTLLPLTMKGRQWLYFGDGPIGRYQRYELLRDWVFRLLRTWSAEPAWLRLTDHRVVVLGFVAAVAVAAKIGRLHGRGQDRTAALLLWAACLDGIYLVGLPAPGHGGRYQPFEVLLALPLLVLAGRSVVGRVLRRFGAGEGWTRGATACLVAVLAVSTGASYATWWRLSRDGIDQINQEHGAMGDWVVSHIAAGDVAARRVAVFDIGRIGYDVRGSLVDLGGLTDPQYLAYLKSRTVPGYLAAHGIRYVVLPTAPEMPERFRRKLLPEEPVPYELEELHTVCSTAERTRAVLAATGAALRCQTAYAIWFPRAASPAVAR